MNTNIHLIAKSILALLLAIGSSVDLARADVSVTLNATDGINDQNTDFSIGIVTYSTSQGLTDTREQNGAVISYGPDGLPGHQSFFATALASAGSSGTGTADTGMGLLRSYAAAATPLGVRDRLGYSLVRIDDSVTFFNSSSQSVPITVLWQIDGILSVIASSGSNAEHHSFFSFGGNNGLPGGTVYSDGVRTWDGSGDSDTWSVYAWDQAGSSYEVVPNTGSSGLSFTGHLLLPPGQSGPYIVTDQVQTFARSGGAADFGNTAGLQIQLPPDVTFTSASGELLAGVTAVSRKTHRAAGDFDITLPLTGNPGIECRKPGPNGSYRIVVTFGNAPTVDGPVTVTSGTGTVSNYLVDGQDVTVNLTGVTNKQTIMVTLGGVHNGAINGDVVIPMQIATGDVNEDGGVSRADVTETQGQIGQPVTEDNFRDDVTVDGQITNADVKLIKQSR